MDFLVEKSPLEGGTLQIEDITAEIMPGVDRALATARRMLVTGTDLHGAEQKLTARICEIGPFLALKLRAFLRSQQPKDAFDILYSVLHYDGGTGAAIASFTEELQQGNTASPEALRALQELFANENSPGSAKANHFVLVGAGSYESADVKYRRASIRQDMVDVAKKLLER